jgi:mono/diheme cytochrome c family protein
VWNLRGLRVKYYTSVRLLCAALSAAALLAQATPPAPDDAKKIAAGRRIYAGEKCAECHLIAGHGNSRFPLDGVGARLSAADLRRWFTHTEEMENAQPKRPAIRMSSRKYRFSDEELSALVAYLQSLTTPRRDPLLNTR